MDALIESLSKFIAHNEESAVALSQSLVHFNNNPDTCQYIVLRLDIAELLNFDGALGHCVACLLGHPKVYQLIHRCMHGLIRQSIARQNFFVAFQLSALPFAFCNYFENFSEAFRHANNEESNKYQVYTLIGVVHAVSDTFQQIVQRQFECPLASCQHREKLVVYELFDKPTLQCECGNALEEIESKRLTASYRSVDLMPKQTKSIGRILRCHVSSHCEISVEQPLRVLCVTFREQWWAVG